ncbi:MAG: glycosyltransferase family 9 protein [Ginsengibacter sp.]
MKNIKKIAILRANAIGDFLVTLPAIQAIRTKFPKAEIVLLGSAWHKSFLVAGRTPIDRVIIVPVMKGIRSEKNKQENQEERERFFEEMNKEHFDVAIHFQGNGISANPFLNRLSAGLTVGLTTENAEPIHRSIPFYYYQSEVLRYLEVAGLIDAKTENIEPQISVLNEDIEEIKGLLNFLGKKQFVVLNPFAVDIRRAWPSANYAPLADWIKEKGFEVIFTGSKEEKEGAEKIISQMKYPAINSCGTLTLGGLAAILQKAALVISGDTGPLHLARAVNTPTVGIYWAPNLINWGPLSKKIHRPVISWDMPCPYCGIIPNDPYPFEPQNECRHEVSFVRDITIGAVRDAAEALLFKKETKEKTEISTRKYLNKMYGK